MNRRSFLRLFSAAAPVAVVAPEYFFAPIGGWIGALRGGHYDLLKMDDLVDRLPNQLPNLLDSYYEKNLIENLKAQLRFGNSYSAVSWPPYYAKQLSLFTLTLSETNAQAIIL